VHAHNRIPAADSILKLDSGFVCEVRHDQFLEDALMVGMVAISHKVIAGIEDADDPEIIAARGKTEVCAAPIALHTR
jgi:hypothetical protein